MGGNVILGGGNKHTIPKQKLQASRFFRKKNKEKPSPTWGRSWLVRHCMNNPRTYFSCTLYYNSDFDNTWPAQPYTDETDHLRAHAQAVKVHFKTGFCIEPYHL